MVFGHGAGDGLTLNQTPLRPSVSMLCDRQLLRGLQGKQYLDIGAGDGTEDCPEGQDNPLGRVTDTL